MSRWFRHYAGMMRDDKLVRVAIRSKQSIERVVWIWGAILESAAEIDDGGRYDVDAAEVAYFLRSDEADINAVLVALSDAGHVADGTVVKWGDRQFLSDRSNTRVAAHRERKRAEKLGGNGGTEAGNGDVTLQERRGNSPETETELEKESPPKPPRKRRGEGKHRFPDDWVLPAVADLPAKARACAEQWTPASYETHGEGFAAYWRGNGKMMSDWNATWCNRLISLHSQVMRDQKFGNAPTAPADAKPIGAEGFRAFAATQAQLCRDRGREQEALDWEAKARGDPPRRASSGPPRTPGEILLEQAATYANRPKKSPQELAA